MKKLFLIMTLIVVTLSSCLKDTRYVDFPNAGNIVNFPLSGFDNFGNDAITSDTAVIQFATDYATANANPALTVTLAVDTTLMTAYNNANPSIQYITLPTADYTISSLTVNIAAGKQYAFTTLTVYKNKLDPSKSYMLPIKIASAGGVPISSNQSVHYYHVIGNTFAGSYTWNFSRYNGYNTPPPAGTAVSSGSFTGKTVTILPVSPTEFQVTSGYYTGTARYDVTFTQVDATHFKNFQISLVASDVTTIFNGNGINVTQPPVFGYGVTPAYDPNATYTYAQALSYFTFQYTVQNSSGYRYCVDNYIHN